MSDLIRTISTPEVSFDTLPSGNAGDILMYTASGWAPASGVTGGHPNVHQLVNGSASAPTYSFATDTDTGIFLKSANILGLAAGGIEVLKITPTHIINEKPIIIRDNTPTIPSSSTEGHLYKSTGDPRLYWRTTSGVIDLTAGGSSTLSFPLAAPASDSKTNPSYAWAGDPQTGLYYIQGGVVGYTSLGNNTVRFDLDGVKVANGNTASPSLSFLSDPSKGLHLNTMGQLAFVLNNNEVMTMSSTIISSKRQLEINSGSALSLGIRFSGDTTTGIYERSGLDEIRFVSNAIDVLAIRENFTESFKPLLIHQAVAPTVLSNSTGALYKSSTGNGLIWKTPTTEVDLTQLFTFPIAAPVNADAEGSITPEYSFSTAAGAGAGMYFNGSNLGFTVQGNTLLSLQGNNVILPVSNSQIRTPNGITTNPPYSFQSQATSGMYLNAVDPGVAISVLGTERLLVRSTITRSRGGLEIVAEGVKFPSLAGRGVLYMKTSGDSKLYFNGGAGEIDLTTGGGGGVTTFPIIANPTGSLAVPSYSFAGYTNYGMFIDTANGELAFSANGVRAFSGGNGYMKLANGGSSQPSLRFNTNPQAGLSYSTVDSAVSIHNTSGIRAKFSDVRLKTEVPVASIMGSLANNSFQHPTDATTGMSFTSGPSGIVFNVTGDAKVQMSLDNVDLFDNPIVFHARMTEPTTPAFNTAKLYYSADGTFAVKLHTGDVVNMSNPLLKQFPVSENFSPGDFFSLRESGFAYKPYRTGWVKINQHVNLSPLAGNFEGTGSVSYRNINGIRYAFLSHYDEVSGNYLGRLLTIDQDGNTLQESTVPEVIIGSGSFNSSLRARSTIINQSNGALAVAIAYKPLGTATQWTFKLITFATSNNNPLPGTSATTFGPSNTNLTLSMESRNSGVFIVYSGMVSNMTDIFTTQINFSGSVTPATFSGVRTQTNILGSAPTALYATTLLPDAGTSWRLFVASNTLATIVDIPFNVSNSIIAGPGYTIPLGSSVVDATYDPANAGVYLLYQNASNEGYVGYVISGGTTITSIVQTASPTPLNTSISIASTAQGSVVVQQNSSNQYVSYSVTGNPPSFNQQLTSPFTSVSIPLSKQLYFTDDFDQLIMFYAGTSPTHNTLNSTALRPTVQSQSMPVDVGEDIIGVVDSNAMIGEMAITTLRGGTSKSFSNLIIGRKYYLDTNGDLTLVNVGTIVGRAIATDEMLLSD
jgi:hypothetical protein